MRKLDFYGLSRSIQDRFIESSRGAAAPAPLAVAPLKEWGSLSWGLASLVALGVWAAFIAYGIGDLDSPFALSSPTNLAIHVLIASVATFSAARSYALSWASGQLPFEPGVYLFPAGIVAASSKELIEYDAQGMTSVTAEGSTVIVQHGSATFRFLMADPESATAVSERVQDSARKWQGMSESSALERARLSPLVDSGILNPLAPTQPHSQARLAPLAVVLVLSLVIGIGAGFGVSVWRDTLSQKALFKAAVAEHSIRGYRAYIERGGNRAEVMDLLLPRAELARAIEQGSVEAVETFLKENPDTQIGGEVQNALRAALLQELEKAQKQGTLAALEKIHRLDEPHELITVELAAARRKVFADAMAAFQAQASAADPDLIPFVQQLLTYAEAHGPRVVVRVVQEFPQDPQRLDKIVSKSRKYYMGSKSLPTQYFLGEQARRREKELGQAVVDRLQAAFHEDILDFELSPLPNEANEEPPEIEVPTITLLHRERLSGGYVGGRPKALFMGLALFMSGTAEIPEIPEPRLSFGYNAWRNPDFSILKDRDKDIPDVYEEMISVAFEAFQNKYLSRWFESPDAPQ